VTLRARLDRAAVAWTRHQRHPGEVLDAAMQRVPEALTERVATPEPESEADAAARSLRWPHLSVYVDSLCRYVLELPEPTLPRSDPRWYVTPLPVPSAAAAAEARALLAEHYGPKTAYGDAVLRWWTHVALALVE
jgi:hypothetical protein